MPILRPYTQQMPAPEGQINVQSSPDDFGAATGRGIQEAGQGAESLNDSERAVAEQKGQIWAIKAASDMRLNQMNAMEQMQQDPDFQKKYGADGSGFVAAYRQQFEDSANAALDAAPTGQARRFLQNQMVEMGSTMSDQAMKFQSVTGAQWATNSLTQTMNQNQSATYMNPSQRQSILDSTNASIDAMPHLDQTQRDKLKLDAKKMSAFAAGRKDAVDNNKDLLGQLDPVLSAKLNPTARMTQVINSDTAVQLPQNTGGDLVKPYDGNRINQIVQAVKSPSQYDDIFQKAAQAYGVDAQELKMRVAAESGMNPNAQGPATRHGQSVGLAQFTAMTAAQYGVEDRTDPQQSIFGMARMLSDLQSKAGGDESKVDKMYYGGESSINWGANTNQYAENLGAVRASLQGGDSVHSSFDQVLASVQEQKDPLKFENTGSRYSYLNDLTFEEQYSIMREAKQNELADITRKNQIAELADKAQKLQQKQTMSGWMNDMIDGKLTVDQIRNDPNVDWDGKEKALNALAAGIVGRGKTDPAIFRDTYSRAHLPDGDPNKLVDQKEVFQLVGEGKLSYEDGKKINEEIRDSDTQEGRMYEQKDKDLMKMAYDRLVQTNMFKSVDPTQAQNYYDFQNAYLDKKAALIKAGISRHDLYDPKSKDFLGNMIDTFNRTPQQQMEDMAAARKAQQSTGGAPTKVKVISPDGKTGFIPVGQMDDAIKQGYKKAP